MIGMCDGLLLEDSFGNCNAEGDVMKLTEAQKISLILIARDSLRFIDQKDGVFCMHRKDRENLLNEIVEQNKQIENHFTHAESIPC